ncbi:MAG: ABC transporter ATP-binding protein [Pseudomonadota bacterium]
MSLRLAGVSKSVAGEVHIHPVNLELQKGTMNVLLGPTLAGKTTLMRLMAGLERPDTGSIFWNGDDVTGRRVQDREVAMVYQQFVNYPSMSVYENIASPLRLQRRSSQEIDSKVREMADLLKLTAILDRKPNEISGGQQQRCAMARALVKDVGLVLMDEPLANLDYKLREELRIEIPRLSAKSGAIFVYATTEPEEALLLGGNTATLSEGSITQFGPSTEVYRQPVDQVTARVYSDPPMSIVRVSKAGSEISFPNGETAKLADADQGMPDGDYRAGFRAHQLKVGDISQGDFVFEAKVVVTELSGSETFVHFEAMGERWIALVPGLEPFEVGQICQVGVRPDDVLYFDSDGRTASVAQPQPLKVGA